MTAPAVCYRTLMASRHRGGGLEMAPLVDVEMITKFPATGLSYALVKLPGAAATIWAVPRLLLHPSIVNLPLQPPRSVVILVLRSYVRTLLLIHSPSTCN